MVARHGPMVLGVCRQLLGDHQHAEDAFQAVFLVLARRARSIRDPDLLGTWLYGVALRHGPHGPRPARSSATDRGRRRRPAGRGAVPPRRPSGRCSTREQAEALHREIDRLPGAFRVPVVLCYFEGLTLDEAAHRLRWPVGTLRSRLARAREKLRRGLTRRGFALSSPAHGRDAGAPVGLGVRLIPPVRYHDPGRDRASRPVTPPAGRSPPPPRPLAQEVLRTMLIHKLKLAAMSLLLLAAVAAGAGYRRPAPSRDPGRASPRRAVGEGGSDGASPSATASDRPRRPGPDDGRRPRPRPGRQTDRPTPASPCWPTASGGSATSTAAIAAS